MTKISDLPQLSAASEYTEYRAVVNAHTEYDTLLTGTLDTYGLVNNALTYGIEDQSALLNLDNHIGWALCGATSMVASEETTPSLFNPCLYYAMYSTSSASTSDVSDWFVPVCSEYAEYPVDGVCKVPLSELMGGDPEITSEAFTDMVSGLDTFDLDHYGMSIAYIPIYNYQDGTTEKISFPSVFSATLTEMMSDISSVTSEYYSATYFPAYVDDYPTAYLSRMALDKIPTEAGLGNLISNVSEAYNILSDFAEYDNYIPMYLTRQYDSYLCKISLRDIPTAEGFRDLTQYRLDNVDHHLSGNMRILACGATGGEDSCGYITISALKAYLGL